MQRYSSSGFTFQPVRLPNRPLPDTKQDEFLPWVFGKRGERGVVVVERVGIGGCHEVLMAATYPETTPEFMAVAMRAGFLAGGYKPIPNCEVETLRALLG